MFKDFEVIIAKLEGAGQMKSWDIVMEHIEDLEYHCKLLYDTTPLLRGTMQLGDLEQSAAEWCYLQSNYISTAKDPKAYTVTCVRNYVFTLIKKIKKEQERHDHTPELIDYLSHRILEAV
jgi:hypothetical protein